MRSSKDLVEGVSERTGGVPLFIEEVTRLLLEPGVVGGVQAIPPTLQQSLAARLDRLGSAREVAQIGAVLGREFAYPLLRDVAELDEPALQASLERLAEADFLFVEGASPQSTYRFKHSLIQDAAYESLLKSRRQALHRRAAEILRDEPERAAAEPEVIAHHFTEAGLDELAIEWWGKAGDQALRRSAFQEAIAHLGKAIEMADKVRLAPRLSTGNAAASGRRLKLQSDYGQAVMWSRGFAAEETGAALARAAEFAAQTDGSSERFATYVGQMNHYLFSGEFRQSEEVAKRFLHEAESAKRSAAASAARYLLGVACLFQGKFSDAQSSFEHTLADWNSTANSSQPAGNRVDHGALAAIHLALVAWATGDPDRARSLNEQATKRVTESGPIQTAVHAYFVSAVLEVFRGDPAAASRSAELLIRLARQHKMQLYAALAQVYLAWARSGFPIQQAGVSELRQAVTDYVKLGNKAMAPSLLALLAKCEADAGNLDAAGATIDEALFRAGESGERWTDASLHRIRGEILLRRNPADPAPAEEAFQTAIAIAKEQCARSYELLASLSLAKLYQSAGRRADAHAVLAPALEGFSPTPEMPEIAEAQALLAALGESKDVKTALAHRQRRLDLQTSYGHALMWAKGFGAEETKAAFARISELGEATDARFVACDALCLGKFMRGELRQAREMAEILLQEAEANDRATNAGAARRMLGLVLLYQGDLKQARSVLQQALDGYVPARDGRTQFRFGRDTEVSAAAYLALAEWHLGEVERARYSIDRAIRRANELDSVAAVTNALFWKTVLESLRDDVSATLLTAEALFALAEQHGIKTYRDYSQVYANWARGRQFNREVAASNCRHGVTAFVTQGNLAGAPYLHGLLGELETPEAALALIDQGLGISQDTGEHFSDPYLYRLRGNILLKRHLPDRASAEAAYQTAIAVAKRQGARSYELLASLSLAKLYQSTDRAADAHAILAPALEGFSPTPEMPEIAEAQALLERLV